MQQTDQASRVHSHVRTYARTPSWPAAVAAFAEVAEVVVDQGVAEAAPGMSR